MYAGRWIARIRDKIVAQGATREEALIASRQSRHKERLEIIFMPTEIALPELIRKVTSILPHVAQVYLVGGAVRNILRGELSSDFDFAAASNSIDLARAVAKALAADFIVLDHERGVARVIHTQGDSRVFLDFADFRDKTLEGDLRGRDFTINAIAYDLRGEAMIDPLGGIDDLTAKRLRACSESAFIADPVRVLRAVRFCQWLNLEVEARTQENLRNATSELAQVSPERVRDELFKMLDGPHPHTAITKLEELGALSYILPELGPMKGQQQSPPHILPVWDHTLAVMAALEELLGVLRGTPPANEHARAFADKLGRFSSRYAEHFAQGLNPERSLRALFFFAALYHDVAKPLTKSFGADDRIHFYRHEDEGADLSMRRARALNLSSAEVERLGCLVQNHMRIHAFATRQARHNEAPTRRAIYRFFRAAGDAAVELVLLVLADARGVYGDTLSRQLWTIYLDLAEMLLENYWEHPQEIVSPPRLIDGNQLMQALGLKPGPAIGELLESIRENQVSGTIKDREQALAFARSELAKQGTSST